MFEETRSMREKAINMARFCSLHRLEPILHPEPGQPIPRSNYQFSEFSDWYQYQLGLMIRFSSYSCNGKGSEDLGLFVPASNIATKNQNATYDHCNYSTTQHWNNFTTQQWHSTIATIRCTNSIVAPIIENQFAKWVAIKVASK